MKKSVFITGIAGSGKSTVMNALNSLGYKTYDMEDATYGLFTMVDCNTGKQRADYNNSDFSMVQNTRKLFNTAQLEKLLENQVESVAFYCGVANDNGKMIPLFHKSIVLRVTPETLQARLQTRKRFANTEAIRQLVLSQKEEFENEMIQKGALAVDANSDPEKITQEIVRLAQV